MTSTTREGLQSVVIATANVRGGSVKIVRIVVSLVASLAHRFDVPLADFGKRIRQCRYARMRSAMSAAGFPFPAGLIGVAVADDGDGDHDDPSHDLAIAIGLLILQGVIPEEAASDIVAVGELT